MWWGKSGATVIRNVLPTNGWESNFGWMNQTPAVFACGVHNPRPMNCTVLCQERIKEKLPIMMRTVISWHTKCPIFTMHENVTVWDYVHILVLQNHPVYLESGTLYQEARTLIHPAHVDGHAYEVLRLSCPPPLLPDLNIISLCDQNYRRIRALIHHQHPTGI